jgi:HEAT repeat protein
MTPQRMILALLMLASVARAETPGERAWNILRTGAAEKSTDRRTQAVRVLGLIAHSRPAAELAEHALADENPQVRVAAAAALGEMGSVASISKLQDALKDKEGSVAVAVAYSLVALKDKMGYETFYEIVTGDRKTGQGLVAEQLQTLHDTKKMAELGVETGLGFIPFAGFGYSAVKVLIENRDQVSALRAAAARVLATDPDPASGVALARTMADKSPLVRMAAIDALARRGNASFLPAVEKALTDENYAVRYTAAAGVIRLSGPKPRTQRSARARHDRSRTR